MIERLQGYKTHAAIVLTIAWVVVYSKVAGVREAVGAENFLAILASLGGLAGIALRAGVQKVHDEVKGS